MATTTNLTTTDPTPTPEAAPTETGTFISNLVYGYTLPSEQEIRAITSAVRRLSQQTTTLHPVILRHLLTIKLLAPEESRDLRIYHLAEVEQFLKRLASQLVQRYQGGV